MCEVGRKVMMYATKDVPPEWEQGLRHDAGVAVPVWMS